MKILLITILFAYLCLGDYEIGKFYIEERDHQQVDDHAVKGAIFYPSNPKEGEKFPVIVFSPGFMFSDSFYDYLLNLFVSKGYIMIIEGSYDYDPISLPLWKAKDMAFLLDFVVNASRFDTESPIYQIVGTQFLSMGHSEGGSAAIVATCRSCVGKAYRSTFAATIVLSGCFVELQDDVHQAIQSLTTPIFWITGTSDCICIPSYQLAEYSNVTSKCKYFANINNASHCMFATPDTIDLFLCTELEDIYGCANRRLDRVTQQELTLKYAFSFVEYTIKGDAASKTVLDQNLAADQQKNVLDSYLTDCS